MTKLKFKTFLLLSAALVNVPVFTNDTPATIQLSPTDKEFYCEITTPNKVTDIWNSVKDAKVNMDTQGVNIDGAKEGQYVSTPGHLKDAPISLIKDYYFKVSKDNEKGGSVTVTPVGFSEDASLNCQTGTGGRKAYEGKPG